MKKFLIYAAAVLTLCSCGASAPKDLYYWGGVNAISGTSEYEHTAYRNYKDRSPETLCQLICVYERMVSYPGGLRKVPPPGICAEYGYLLLQAGTADIFEAHATNEQKKVFASSAYTDLFRERGAEMFEMEMRNYPESALFLKPLVQKIKSQL